MSGRQSKRIRKEKRFPKKAVAGAAVALFCATPVVTEGGEFILSVYPDVSFPIIKFDDSLKPGFGGGVGLTYRPVEFINICAEGDYKTYTFDTKEDIGNLSVIGGKVGAGYHLPISDRMGLDINAAVGYYSSNHNNIQELKNNGVSVNGISASGAILFSYKLGPVFSVFGGGGVEHLAYKNAKFITSAEITPGLSINLTKAFSNRTNISFDDSNLKPVFPVFYSWYNENSFGTIELSNHEDATITDVEVSFYHPEYMGQPQLCGTKKVLKKGETFSVDLKAFFNERMLNLNEKNDSLTSVIVEYKYLGAKRTATFPLVVPIYGRNNMSWEDDRCASAFVSSKDPAAMWFAKYVVSTIRDDIRNGLPTNIQYAMAIFEALDQFGINYVKDPTSAFEDNVGTASIDFLQFPYQTLMYRGGDCDDLSILVCSLFESIGIKTAFITIPGHIFMAFDSGFTVEEANDYFISLDEFIVEGDRVWVPLEITLTDEGFNKAWHKGAWEWNVADRSGNAMLYKMEDSWKIYKPVSVPGATAHFSLPEDKYVAKLFSHSVDTFVVEQITPKIAYYENRIAIAPTAQNYNDLGVLYARYGLFELAEQQFRVARAKKYLPAVLNTANLYFSIKDYERAANWYKEVLSEDDSVLLATLGLARCAYEVADYEACDSYFEQVYENNRALAKQYSYLGAFEETTGRSFSLGDRLVNTIWITSSEKSSGALQAVDNQIASQTTDVIVKTPSPEASAIALETNTPVVAVVPVNPEEEIEKNENEEEPLEGGNDPNETLEGADENTELAENVVEDESYVGIDSELEFNVLSIDELTALAEGKIIDTIPVPEIIPEPAIAMKEETAVAEVEIEEKTEIGEKTVEVAENVEIAEAVEVAENVEIAEAVEVAETVAVAEAEEVAEAIEVAENLEVAATVEVAETVEVTESEELEESTVELASLPTTPETSTASEEPSETSSEPELLPVVETSVTSLLTDVPLRAVPRFTTQPSEEWAPKEAYTAETIPGMKSFEEEMGNYQNEKAFLYKDEYSFAVNPGEDIEDKKDEVVENAVVLEVNPFSSFLKEEEASQMEKITSFKLEDVNTVAEEPQTTELTDAAGTTPGAENSSVETPDNSSVVANSSLQVENIPQPEIIPEPQLAVEEETAVAEPVIVDNTSEKSTSTTTDSNKSIIPIIGAIAAASAAAAAIFIAKRRKEK